MIVCAYKDGEVADSLKLIAPMLISGVSVSFLVFLLYGIYGGLL